MDHHHWTVPESLFGMHILRSHSRPTVVIMQKKEGPTKIVVQISSLMISLTRTHTYTHEERIKTFITYIMRLFGESCMCSKSENGYQETRKEIDLEFL